ncbi:MAG: methyltransferase domain-containing protein [Anaerolineae bacterium]|nr:methyltransferase domain-containing protein [Anaerolineae bacterium]
MGTDLRIVVIVIVVLLVFPIVLHSTVRAIRYFHKFPIPQFLADLIDNPLRRKIMPPDVLAIRHGIEPGMRVMEIGPGNGRYTMAFARCVGAQGKVVAVDIEPKMIRRVSARAKEEGVTNIEARVADVYELPYDDGTFDAVTATAVIGEIPDPDRAIHEFHRVLSSSGILVFSEILLDPDYPLAGTLIRKASAAGFRPDRRIGNFFFYTLIFKKKG